MSHGPSARAAQMSMRCAALLEAMAATWPPRTPGPTVAVSSWPPPATCALVVPSAQRASRLAQPSSMSSENSSMLTRRTSQEPMPRTATMSMWSPARFLSRYAACAISHAGCVVPLGNPWTANISSICTASSGVQRPLAAHARAMMARPAATAWPCVTVKSLNSSMEWAAVWPRLSSLRCPASRSSACTTSRLMDTQRSTMRRSWPARGLFSHSKSSGSHMTPYFTTSPMPSLTNSLGRVLRQPRSQTTRPGW